MISNQTAATASLDLWVQSGGALDTVKADLTVAADAERQVDGRYGSEIEMSAAQRSLARVCAPELAAAQPSFARVCAPELTAAQPSYARVCAPELQAAAVTIGVTCGGWEPALKSAAYTHTIQCRGGW